MIMAESLFGVIVMLGVLAVAACLFVVWVIVSVLKLMLWGIGALLGVGRNRVPPLRRELICRGAMCRAPNPPMARFCRRCGRPLGEGGYGAMRRAAVW